MPHLDENPHGQKFHLLHVEARHGNEDKDLQVWKGEVGFDISHMGEKLAGLEEDVRRLTEAALTEAQR